MALRPRVERKRQRAANARIVERLFLVVWRHRAGDIPITLLDGEAVAKRGLQFVARRGRQTAELDRRAVGADCIDPRSLFVGKDADKPIEVGQRLVVIIGVALAPDRLTGLIAGEPEGAGAHDIFLVPMRVLIEDRPLVDPVERAGERGEKGAGREFEAEDDGLGVGRLNLVDHQKVAGARREDALRRKGDRVKGGGDIGGGERRAVVEFDAGAELERPGFAVVAWRRQGGA
jgi:hypothetical protein